MTKSLLIVALHFLFTGFGLQESKKTDSALSIVPKPVSLVSSKGTLDLKKGVSISIEADPQIGNGKSSAGFLTDFLKTKSISTSSNASNKSIRLILKKNDAIKAEGYSLSVSKKEISISANTEAGLFYGVQTFIQLTPINDTKIPFVEITDYPRFSYRGLHLDVGRHMFPTAFIKKYIDLMARHKFNRFHWHLTEDQGWRIEIKKYPKLQEIAAYRKETLIGHGGAKDKKYDGIKYGGFYTQAEIKEVAQYAAERYVTIIPEIELPGHSQAALSAYPELGCTGGPYEAATKWGVFEDVYCAGKEETFKFLEGVIDEVVELFPGEYIHIGGDECPKTSWKKCPQCQNRIKTEGLKDEHELQSYFIQRIEKYVNSKGKKIIGWDEILEGGLAPNATVMSWRGEKGGIAAAQLNHDVMMTPGNWCYLDHYQDSSKTEPLAIGGFTTVKEVYGYEPLPAQLSATESKYILGAQGNVWTEYMKTSDHVEYMVYPRACALAEVVWSPKESRDYNGFLQRMKVHLGRLDAWKVNYAKHINKEFSN